ncbi:Gmad2 immunoglobulin-like domain-containing protein [Nocardioides sp. InS609-2]|uniref:Gmad2 immunoglobulin-like domain-containing protein n=1 Tax=Nocardioides sp. InS609-2 TaxID=2760705 RepID=UPI0020C14876|nr:Gmad2 immunoglobulin-like domain-containing protein [Nocardioides sp. InS609-2]
MTPDEPDDKLARALHDAVSRIEPRDALAEIRSRTRPRSDAKVETMSNRTWPLVLLGAAATAAVIGVVAFVGGFGGDDDPDPDPAASSSQAAEPTPSEPASPSEPESSSATVGPEPGGAVPLYFIGDTERGGPRLYREFQAGDLSLETALDLLSDGPTDPDYRTAWQKGSFDGVEDDGDVISVRFADDSLNTPLPGMSEAEAQAAVQQVVYTVQAVAQRRAPVQFMINDGPAQTVYGVNTAEPITNAPILEALSHMSITDPEQGTTVSGTLELSGVANSFEASSGWELRQGDKVVKKGVWMAEGWMEDKLFPFAESIKLDGVAPGDYTIWATTDDPTGGTEGVGAMTDSKDITIQ